MMVSTAHKYSKQIAKIVSDGAGMGLRYDDLVILTDVPRRTLIKYYRPDFVRGSVKASQAVATSLFNEAIGKFGGRTMRPNVSACIFWLKARRGWHDNTASSFDDLVTEENPTGQPPITEVEGSNVVVYIPNNGRGNLKKPTAELDTEQTPTSDDK